MSIWILCSKAVVVFLFLGIAFRLMGKRQIGQLNVYDLAMIMAIANAVQNAMTTGKGDLIVGIGLSTTLILLGWGFSRLFVLAPTLEKRIIGSPTILMNRGHILEDRLRRERVTDEELLEAFRTHGYADASKVSMAVLEVDGSISIVPKD